MNVFMVVVKVYILPLNCGAPLVADKLCNQHQACPLNPLGIRYFRFGLLRQLQFGLLLEVEQWYGSITRERP